MNTPKPSAKAPTIMGTVPFAVFGNTSHQMVAALPMELVDMVRPLLERFFATESPNMTQSAPAARKAPAHWPSR